MKTLSFARTFASALETADIEKVAGFYQPDAEIWHNFDGKTQTVSENLKLLAFMRSKAQKLTYKINRLEEITGGYVQHHTLSITFADGTTASTEALAMITLKKR